MLLLSHLYLAKEALNDFKSKNSKEYYLGSILPDIRYFSNILRSSTHFPIDELNSKLKKLDSDFIKGYFVHLISDKFVSEYNLYNKIRKCFPFIINKLIRDSIINVCLDLYFLERLKKEKRIELSGVYNIKLKMLGIGKEDFEKFCSSTSHIVSSLSIEVITQEVFNNNELKNSWKIRYYLKLSQVVLNSSFLKKYIVKRVDLIVKEFLVQFKIRLDLERKNNRYFFEY